MRYNEHSFVDLLRISRGKLEKLIPAEPAGCENALFGLEPGMGGRCWVASEWEVRVAGDIVVEI